MNIPTQPNAIANPYWSTASFGDSVETTPMELSALGEHLDRCQGARGRFFALGCVVETMNSLIAPRFVTTLVVATLMIGIGSLVL